MKDKIVEKIKSLLPIAQFRKPYQRPDDYNSIWIPSIAEDLMKRVPKDHTIELIENEIFIAKKEPQLEGYEAFVADAQRIHGEENKIPFSQFMEDAINESDLRQLLI